MDRPKLIVRAGPDGCADGAAPRPDRIQRIFRRGGCDLVRVVALALKMPELIYAGRPIDIRADIFIRLLLRDIKAVSHAFDIRVEIVAKAAVVFRRKIVCPEAQHDFGVRIECSAQRIGAAAVKAMIRMDADRADVLNAVLRSGGQGFIIVIFVICPSEPIFSWTLDPDVTGAIIFKVIMFGTVQPAVDVEGVGVGGLSSRIANQSTGCI